MTVGVLRRLALVALIGNAGGAAVVTGFVLYLAPTVLAADQYAELQRRSLPVLVVFTVTALGFGAWWVLWRPFAPIARWLAEDRAPTESERERVLRHPRTWAIRTFAIWMFAAVVATSAGASVSTKAIPAGILPTVLGAGMTCAVQYLMVERAMRPITALVLTDSEPLQSGGPGVAVRLSAFWALGTGVPLLGIAIFAGLDLAGVGFDRARVVAAALFLAVLGLIVGFAATRFAARSVAEPLASLRMAQADIRAGDFDARVAVEDGSEVGLLQAGFNHMASGLAERERLRHAFGAYVDPELTERVLREGTDLAGEDVEVSVLFTDVRDFTAYAEAAEARDAVARLNALYSEIVPIVRRHGGHANKFIGDGLLAVFGAPDRRPDHARRAVAAGRDIVETIRSHGGEFRIGVGINSGNVIAGTIGGGGRVDFTVIGDTVNTAARVESATRDTGDDLLITHATRSLIDDDDAWIERPAFQLKGKSQPVRVYALRTGQSDLEQI
ncbi:MAG: adenylate/guanylate cyclase domain-containing protein [Mycobacterium sp.]|uniref:adenylate/guanylate cyclase domain-containing protein n=1 Tax=Mycobacterium sp. TaxID=1785 RepID=UPI003BB17A18